MSSPSSRTSENLMDRLEVIGDFHEPYGATAGKPLTPCCARPLIFVLVIGPCSRSLSAQTAIVGRVIWTCCPPCTIMSHEQQGRTLGQLHAQLRVRPKLAL